MTELSCEPPVLSVIVPTMNEYGNIAVLVGRLHQVLSGIAWEVVFVDDDSTDGTIEEIRRIAGHDRRVRLLHRIGRRGLSSACIEGIQSSTAGYVAVMDADLQHDEALLPQMLAALRDQPVDIVIGSRYVAGGGVGTWDKTRIGISSVATRLGQMILRSPVADPMSGFFMLRRDAFDAAARRLSAISFKILIDILASSPQPLRVLELPYVFRERLTGESKLDATVVWEYLLLLADKMVGPIVPVRFLLFSLVGAIGLAAHLIVLAGALHSGWMSFGYAQGLATVVAMIGNFALNNALTYRDRRLKGLAFLRGLVSFCLICGIGAAANIGVASVLVGTQTSSWWLAGIAGAAMSSVWNYAVSSVVTWKRA